MGSTALCPRSFGYVSCLSFALARGGATIDVDIQGAHEPGLARRRLACRTRSFSSGFGQRY